MGGAGGYVGYGWGAGGVGFVDVVHFDWTRGGRRGRGDERMDFGSGNWGEMY